jgi:hypothetical protein
VHLAAKTKTTEAGADATLRTSQAPRGRRLSRCGGPSSSASSPSTRNGPRRARWTSDRSAELLRPPLLRSLAGHILLDIVLAAWAAIWICIGVTVASDVRGLARLSDTVGAVGSAVEQVGATLRSLDDVPILGARLPKPAATIEEAGRRAIRSARETRGSARSVGTLLGVSIVLIPTLPVLVIYLPERIAFERDRRAIRRALLSGDDATLDEVLALRAVAGLPYHRLRAASGEPGAELAAGRYARLADIELARLGLRRRRGHARRQPEAVSQGHR